MTGNLKLFELKKLEDTRMKIVIINGSARKGNTLTAINAFIKGASEKNEIEIIEPDKLNIAPSRDVVSVNALRDASIRMIQILQLIRLLPQI